MYHKGIRNMFVTIIMVLCFFTKAQAALVGHWDFEEGSGTIANDSSGNALNGAISGASYTAGKIGKYALDFNGINTFVEVGNNPLLSPDSIAISLWFKPKDHQAISADILDKGHGVVSSPYFTGYVFQYGENPDVINANPNIINAIYGNGTAFPPLFTTAEYADDQWHHIVANLGAAEMSLYMDNFLVASTSGFGPIADNDSPIYFGRHRTRGRYFNGLIDDVRIYDAPLSAMDVSNLYNNTPVPEPTTLLLLGSGLCGLIGFKRKK